MSQLERIVRACGGELYAGGRRALIPGPGHLRQDRSVSLYETDDGRELVHCFSPRDDWRTVSAWLQTRGLKPSPANSAPPIPAPRTDHTGLERARVLWDEARPIEGTFAARYLVGRAIPRTSCASVALRFHPGVTSLDDQRRRPALVAAIADAAGALQGVQVTLLSPTGAGKAAVSTPRRVIGAMRRRRPALACGARPRHRRGRRNGALCRGLLQCSGLGCALGVEPCGVHAASRREAPDHRGGSRPARPGRRRQARRAPGRPPRHRDPAA
jgi:hypothetical protein